MCGICGVFNFKGERADQALVRRMADTILHRGPDAEGYYFSGPVGLGSRRLSIIDLAGGDMPVYNEDGAIAIVFNGEIYGYVELRDELERRGHRFATHSDTETIVHAYEEFGPRCVEHLNGMFAFALWDSRRQELFLARDRLGEKPLFYAQAGGRFVFASEIKALLQDPACPREVNDAALIQYLTALYIPYPHSIFQGIAKLPPGHSMRVSAEGVKVERYWFPERAAQAGPRRLTLNEAIEEVRPLLADAVRLQMRSDVPVGAFLSAGMDSTSVVAYAVKTTRGAHMKTFAVGFEGADWDERPGARAVAQVYETEHYDITVSLEDVWDLLPRLVWLMDEPMADGSTVPLHVMSTLARQHVKVILCGAGGDELFAGYPRYAIGQVPFARRALQSLPQPLKQAATRLGYVYSDGFGHRVRVALRDVDRHYYEDNTWFSDAERRALTGRNGAPYADVVALHYARLPGADPVNRLMFVDANTYMSDDLLPMTDRMTMGVSLEGRVPFLDYRLVEWALALPSSLKLHHGTSKYVLRRAMEGLLPTDILNRPKRGFGPPLGAWLRGGLLDYTRQLLLGPRAQSRGLYGPEYVQRLLASDLDEHRVTQQIWTLLVLELWYRIFVDDGRVAAPPASLQDLL
jgi:asparagine synthase (glutamine-hydrolysing)